MKVLITGANGFVGRNLISNLSLNKEIEIYKFDKDNTEEELDKFKKDCEFIFHLAMYYKIINEVDGSISKEELLAFKGPFKVSFDFKRKLFGECITNLKLENPVLLL